MEVKFVFLKSFFKKGYYLWLPPNLYAILNPVPPFLSNSVMVNKTFTVTTPKMGIIMVSGIVCPHNLEK